MHFRDPVSKIIFGVTAVCLVKLAFFSTHQSRPALIPPAFAEGSIVEWNDAQRIVTTSDDGATTYVWDYTDRTKVRRYSIEKDALKMQLFELDK